MLYKIINLTLNISAERQKTTYSKKKNGDISDFSNWPSYGSRIHLRMDLIRPQLQNP